MDSVYDSPALPGLGCPIRKSPDHSLFSGSPKLIAASHVLHRLSTPRHPPIALSSLTINPLPWETPKDFFLPDSLVKEQPETNSISGKLLRTGGGERIRTDDPLRAKQALFHLSYTPDF